MKVEISYQPQPNKHRSLSESPISSDPEEADDDNDMVESESSSSEASDSSMSESSGNSEPGSAEPEPELEHHVPQSQPSNDFPPAQEAFVDYSSVAERPGPQDSISVTNPSEEASGLQELTTALDNDEPVEVEDRADEAYSPKLDASDNEEEMDIKSVSGSSHGGADMKLTPKFQEQVVIASKNDALDVR